MKRIIITIVIFLFGIGCGFGAFFMLKTGTDMKQEEISKAELIGLEDIRIEKGSKLPDEIYHIKGNENVTNAEVDVTAVDTSTVGTYPIKYTYYDKNKKQYSKTINCTVYEKEVKQDTEEKKDIQDKNTQEYVPPKTGDEGKIFILSVLIGTSVSAICICIYTLRKNRKGEDGI